MSAATGRWIRIAAAAAAIAVVTTSAAGAWLIIRGPHDELATLSGHRDGAFCLALSPDGTTVASGGGEGTICLWDVSSKKQKAVLTGHSGRVLALAWSPDGTTLATSGADKSVWLWDTASGTKKAKRSNLPRPITGLAFSSDGKFLAAAVETAVFIWGTDLAQRPLIIHGHRLYVAGLTFLPGGHELVTFSCDKTVRIWDLDSSKLVAVMPGPGGHCHGLALSADGKTLACIGGGRVHLYDLEQRRPLEPIVPNARTLCGVAFSPDMRRLALGSEDKVVVIWDLAEKKERQRLHGHSHAVGPLAFLPDGQTLVTVSHDSKLKLWKVE